MKANEIPEKIYLSYETDDEDDKDHIFIDYMWHIHPFEGKNLTNIEYIRTDAFIKKACEFIETYPHLFMGVLRSEVINDFKNYMKGE